MAADDDDFDFLESNTDDTDPDPEVVEDAPALPPPRGSRPLAPAETREITREQNVADWQKHFERGVAAGRKDYRKILLIVMGDSEFTIGVLDRIDRILNGEQTPATGSRRPPGS